MKRKIISGDADRVASTVQQYLDEGWIVSHLICSCGADFMGAMAVVEKEGNLEDEESLD